MRIKGWEKFQHYKHRNPPWIRLYRDLLNDADYFSLPAEAAKYLPLLWLLAAEGAEGELPCIEKIAFRLRLTKTQAELILSNLQHWLVQDASDMLAPRKQDATPETETETETETELERESERESESETERDMVAAPPPPLDECKVAFNFYNEAAKELELPVAISLTKARRTKLRALIQEHGLGNWFNAVNNIRRQPFLQGKNNRGWTADFDFLLQAKSFSRTLEGFYIGKKFSRFEEEGKELIEWARAKDRANEAKTSTNNVVYLEPPAGGEGGTDAINGRAEGKHGDCIPLRARPPGVDES